LFTDVQDQVLLLVEFDHELMERRRKDHADTLRKEGKEKGKDQPGKTDKQESEAIKLLVDNIHSIPVCFISCRRISTNLLGV